MDEIEWSKEARLDMVGWRRAKTVADVCELNARFMEGEARFAPGFITEALGEESESIGHYLAAINRRGFLTQYSQPGLKDGYFRQRAYVEGLTSVEIALEIWRMRLFTDLYIFITRNWSSEGVRTPVTTNHSEVIEIAGVFPSDSLGFHLGTESPKTRRYAGFCSKEVIRELEKSIFVCIIDLQWGRHGYLWETLTQEICLGKEKIKSPAPDEPESKGFEEH